MADGSRPRRSNLRAALYALYIKLKKKIWALLEDLFEVRRWSGARARANRGRCGSRCRVKDRPINRHPSLAWARAGCARLPEACAR